MELNILFFVKDGFIIKKLDFYTPLGRLDVNVDLEVIYKCKYGFL